MNQKNYELFWYWVNEREKIWMKKQAGEPWPWTKDKILQKYKFTNVYREKDKVTIQLRERTKRIKNPIKLFWHIVVFRMFNWPPTYDKLLPIIDSWTYVKAVKILRKMKDNKEKIFTGAYIVTNSGVSGLKYELMAKALTKIHKSPIKTLSIERENSLRYATDYLCQFPMIGKFVAYEIVTDLRHTKILNRATDINVWANVGPGAKRGIKRIWDAEKIDPLSAMQFLLSKANFQMEMRDIEHSLCEFHKYMKVKLGEGRPRGLYHHGNIHS